MAPRLQSLALALNAAMIYLGIAIGSALGAGVLGHFGLQGLGIAGGLVGLVALLHLWLSQRVSTASRPV